MWSSGYGTGCGISVASSITFPGALFFGKLSVSGSLEALQTLFFWVFMGASICKNEWLSHWPMLSAFILPPLSGGQWHWKFQTSYQSHVWLCCIWLPSWGYPESTTTFLVKSNFNIQEITKVLDALGQAQHQRPTAGTRDFLVFLSLRASGVLC